LPLIIPAQFLCSTSENFEFGKTQGLQLAAFPTAYPAELKLLPLSWKKIKILMKEPHKNALWRALCFCLLISQDIVKLKPSNLSVAVKPMLVQEVQGAQR